jgi:hypothetical protein
VDSSLTAREYASHLTDADLRLLAALPGAAGPKGQARPGDSAPHDGAWLRGEPQALLERLEHPGLFDAVTGPGLAGSGWAVPASPFLVFAVFVQRATAELASMDYVLEPTGLRQRVPLFDAPALREFLAEPARRLFLTELLASYTHVASGRYQVRIGGRVRTRRYSELDPVRLAGLLDAVPPAEQPGIYRRLGDAALFLTGVFPGYVTTRAFGPFDAARLLRAARLPGPERDRLGEAPAIDLLEHLGSRWYRAASELAPVQTARLALVGDVAGRFRQARRVLNHLADRYLLPPDAPWFAPPAS